ncbi:MAG TPA: adenylate/guanylate cyclase domain-containing protein [bacterium]
MSNPPSGTVTFLFADIEDSTRLLHQLGARYPKVIEDYHRLVRGIFQAAGGYEEDPAGEGLFVVFPHAADALNAALAAQRAVATGPWPEEVTLRVRMGLHTGQPIVAGGGYIGLEVHRAARIASVGWGGQVLLSQATADAVAQSLPDGAGMRDLGEHRLKDLLRREQIFQFLHPDLRSDFPPLRSLDTLPHNLPHQLTTLVGREREIGELKERLATARLVTIAGPGGTGKTRLALQVAADLADRLQNGVWLAELAGVPDAARIPVAVASAVGARVEGAGERSPFTILADHLQRKRLLIILDNCEYLAEDCAAFVAALFRRCPGVVFLATSWRPLDLEGESVFRLSPLTVPDAQSTRLEELVQAESVRLFVERAVAAQSSFALTEANAPVVSQICRRLDGNALGIELAAGRAKVLSADQIAARLSDRFKLLTGGSRTAPPRQQSLRATMDWGYGLLSEEERILFHRLSIFQAGWTPEAAAAVCAGMNGTRLDVDRIIASLTAKSMVLVEDGSSPAQCRLPEMVRQYGREKLQESGEAPEVERRHRDWMNGVVSNA